MNLKDFKIAVDRAINSCERQRRDLEKITVGIKIFVPGSIGGAPIVPVKNLWHGIDWDSNKCIIMGDAFLTRIAEPEMEARLKHQEELSWKYLKQQGYFK